MYNRNVSILEIQSKTMSFYFIDFRLNKRIVEDIMDSCKRNLKWKVIFCDTSYVPENMK